MQTIIPSLAHTFADDALALARGVVRVTRDLAGSAFAAALARFTAPIDRMARTCDVAGVLPVAANRRKRFGVFGLLASLRALQELT
jgi:hypothetical protein